MYLCIDQSDRYLKASGKVAIDNMHVYIINNNFFYENWITIIEEGYKTNVLCIN